ncbi:MAG TPA: class IV adenylate cyclase [Spirochaetota bacterium]|nr:class IV adenylate cyclase [Spirochaetota bacterium]
MAEELEIEIKAWCESHDSVRSLLESAGALLSGTRDEVDIYFNHPARDFAQTDEALRIRSVNGKCRLTYKGPKLSTKSKARVEHETDAGDYESIKSIILSLGFTVSGSVEKKRSIYILNGIEICIDDVAGLGTFIELEKKGQLGRGIEEELFKLAAELGLSRFERKSYLELKYFS